MSRIKIPQDNNQTNIGTQYEPLPVDIHSDFGACFHQGRKYRYSLWRIWDRSKPLAMFVGLNPSTANEQANDRTVQRVMRICRFNGLGGFYMMNCFPLVSTDPKKLTDFDNTDLNFEWLQTIGSICTHVVFAWGNFKQVKNAGIDKKLAELFPEAEALFINKNGAPKHPLFCKTKTTFVKYKKA